MSTLTHAQKLAFAREIAEVLANNSTELTAKGYDPTTKIADLGTQSVSAEKAEANQAQAQAAAKQATIDSNATMDTVYNNASGSVDIVGGILGKDDPIVQKLRKIRGAMNR
jgi:phage-related tail fiber protein